MNEEKRKEEHMRIHLKCLSKSQCAKDCGESTVILLGYAVSIVEEEIAKVKKESIEFEKRRIKNIIKNHKTENGQ